MTGQEAASRPVARVKHRGLVKRLSGVMENVTAYRLLQSTHSAQKFEPVRTHADLSRVRRVLDVGCGPGSNAHHFQHVDYLGVDLNEDCIRHAQHRFPDKRFMVADISDSAFRTASGSYDFILLNSILHHVDDRAARTLLSDVAGWLTADGHVHIVELVLPATSGVARFMALNDRGDFARPVEEWRELFHEHFAPVVFAPFTLKVAGLPWLELVYFKGASRTASGS